MNTITYNLPDIYKHRRKMALLYLGPKWLLANPRVRKNPTLLSFVKGSARA